MRDCQATSLLDVVLRKVPAPTARILKINGGSRAVENPAPHRTAVLECFRNTAVGRGNKSTPQTQNPTDFLQTDSCWVLRKLWHPPQKKNLTQGRTRSPPEYPRRPGMPCSAARDQMRCEQGTRPRRATFTSFELGLEEGRRGKDPGPGPKAEQRPSRCMALMQKQQISD